MNEVEEKGDEREMIKDNVTFLENVQIYLGPIICPVSV